MLEDLSMGMRGVASTNCPKVSINDNTHNTTDQLHNGQNNPTKFDKVDSGISGKCIHKGSPLCSVQVDK